MEKRSQANANLIGVDNFEKNFTNKTFNKSLMSTDCIWHNICNGANPSKATLNTANNDQTTQSRTTRYVLSQLVQTHRQQVSQKHSRKGIQDSAQESESRETKGFDEEKLYKLSGISAKQLIPLELIKFLQGENECDRLWSTTHSSSTLIQKKNEQGSQRGNNKGGCGSPSKECN
ncbi:hypothetical protein BB561_005247 [Smittium simulii]|uniref:Uncharacterized protein n=1 Tax=Smittium simulii TaxID=133385 RepID=A0A2T9YBB9_9FUNG|nr:hypothetical protein BB561_005247 [Smittium simulii]